MSFREYSFRFFWVFYIASFVRFYRPYNVCKYHFSSSFLLICYFYVLVYFCLFALFCCSNLYFLCSFFLQPHQLSHPIDCRNVYRIVCSPLIYGYLALKNKLNSALGQWFFGPFTLIYLFLTYGLSIWGNTYNAILGPLITLQKRAIRAFFFSKPDEHAEPLFKEIQILKLTDLVTLHNALLTYHYYYNLLPSFFEIFFQTVASRHSYNTRLASKSTYYINTIKTNYGKFNICFAAVKVWNHLDESIKHLPLKMFKNKVKLKILQSYCS